MVSYEIVEVSPEGITVKGSGGSMWFAAQDHTIPWSDYINPGDWWYTTWIVLIEPWGRMQPVIVEADTASDALDQLADKPGWWTGTLLADDDLDNKFVVFAGNYGDRIDPESFMIFKLENGVSR